MSFEITGKVIEKFDVVQVSDKFRKREFVIENIENNNGMEFTNNIKFQLTQDRCDLVNDVNVGDEIKVNFNIRGNRWERDGRVNYFTNLDAWRIEKQSASQGGDTPPFSVEDMPPAPEEDDLPF